MSATPTNIPEYSVSELAGSIKRTMEETFGRVRVRGELGRVTIARSGHCYLDIKDDKAVINSIIWKGVMGRLSMVPEEGMEVIVEGRMSTYPGRSNYQLIIESLELAGAGALMALLEKRKQALAKEGLFAEERKVALPYLPKVIGVVTSPTGAVIRDILHRIEDRFPVHVILWPVTVQGEGSAPKIAAAISGFNHYEPTAQMPRPDVLIVGRGGGSVEDLWCFNEEVVVRAAAASKIPLISAVGHETDWTLIDYASDYRAPTPTGAAEVAVPVRSELMLLIEEFGQRIVRSLQRNASDAGNRLAAARLPRLDQVLAVPSQRLDRVALRLPDAARLFERSRNRLALAGLPSLGGLLRTKAAQLSALRLPEAARLTARSSERVAAVGARLRPELARRGVESGARDLERLTARLSRAGTTRMGRDAERLARAGSLLEAYSYQGVLERGFALVTDAEGQVVRAQAGLSDGDAVSLEFADGMRGAVIGGEGVVAQTPKPKAKPRKRKVDARPTGQRDLF